MLSGFFMDVNFVGILQKRFSRPMKWFIDRKSVPFYENYVENHTIVSFCSKAIAGSCVLHDGFFLCMLIFLL